MEKSSAKSYFKIKSGQLLPGHSSDYAVDQYLGQGSFGTVIRCRKVNSSEVVAVKIIRNNYTEKGEKEAKQLEIVRKLDPDRNNLVKFHEHFMYENYLCLVFEKLDNSLYHFMKKRNYTPLALYEIRPIAQQMLIALKALKSINLVHADIKPDNVMLVSHMSQPFKVKLIDFGLATEVSNIWNNGIVQHLGYRAPEVLLKHPDVNEAVDMWSLGCVLAYLYLGHNLYQCDNELQAMRAIMVLNGRPDNDFLDAASKTRCFFNLVKKQHHHEWWLKTMEEYFLEKAQYAPDNCFPPLKFHLMEELLAMQKMNTDAYMSGDAVEVISLLKKMLEVNPRKRIVPEEALKHNFITMKHLNLCNNYAYIGLSKVTMSVCSYDTGNCISTENTVKKGTYGGRTDTDDQQVPPDTHLSEELSEGDVKLSKKPSGKLLFSRLFRRLHRSGEQEVTSPPARLTEDEQGSSESVTDTSGFNSHQHEDPEMQLSSKVSDGDVTKKPPRIRLFFSRMLRALHIHRKKDNINDDIQQSVPEEQQDTSEILTVHAGTAEDRSSEQETSAPAGVIDEHLS